VHEVECNCEENIRFASLAQASAKATSDTLHTPGKKTQRYYPPCKPREAVSMLVLSRRRDESIMIGKEITVTIIDIRGDKVRLGIDAPKSISVHREEVFHAIQKEQSEDGQRSSI
tara:strand:+ start:2622 stop:2966 length:345 start_codon:yes stop_codon:yes gene_type:complete